MPADTKTWERTQEELDIGGLASPVGDGEAWRLRG